MACLLLEPVCWLSPWTVQTFLSKGSPVGPCSCQDKTLICRALGLWIPSTLSAGPAICFPAWLPGINSSSVDIKSCLRVPSENGCQLAIGSPVKDLLTRAIKILLDPFTDYPDSKRLCARGHDHGTEAACCQTPCWDCAAHPPLGTSRCII